MGRVGAREESRSSRRSQCRHAIQENDWGISSSLLPRLFLVGAGAERNWPANTPPPPPAVSQLGRGSANVKDRRGSLCQPQIGTSRKRRQESEKGRPTPPPGRGNKLIADRLIRNGRLR